MFKFKPEFGIRIPGNIIKDIISVEESALIELKKFPDYTENIIREYEIEKRKSTVPIYPPKNKSDYNLFLHFYRAAKKDLKERGHISDKTLEIIKNS